MRLLTFAVGWGLGFWLIGYVLGIVLFAFVPVALIGWIITPIGTLITIWVLLKVRNEPPRFYLLLSIAWTSIAVLFDYVFIVKAFSPSDGYYKPDVYLYYALTFLLPLAIGWWPGWRAAHAAHGLTLTGATSLLVCLLIAVASAVGLASGSAEWNASDATAGLGVVASTGGVLIAGFRAYDVFNLLVALPLLVALVVLVARGSVLARLLWPGALFYILYTYALYLIGAPFGPLFLVYVALVSLSALNVVGVVGSIQSRDVVTHTLADAVPGRLIGGLLLALGLLTVGQDAAGALATAFAGGESVEPLARQVWTVDLALEAPAVIAGGVLLWRRQSLGYAVSLALLLQYGLTPLALASVLAVQPLVTGAPLQPGTIITLMVFAAVCFVPIELVARRVRVPHRALTQRSHAVTYRATPASDAAD
jgi:hypothetical protein